MGSEPMKLNPFDPPFVVPTGVAKQVDRLAGCFASGRRGAPPLQIFSRSGSGKGYLDPKNHVSSDEAVEAIERLRLSERRVHC